VVGLVVGGGVVVSGGSAICAIGRGIVSALNRLVGLVPGVTRGSDSRARVRGVVAWAVVVRSGSGKPTSRNGDGADFRVAVAGGAVRLLALPELHAAALCVAVVWAGTEGLLLLVVLHEEHLDEGGDEEEECADDGDGEAGGIEVACCAERGGVGDLVALVVGSEALFAVCGSVTQRCADVAFAGGCAVAGQDRDGDHGAEAENVEEYAEEGEDALRVLLACVIT
jgi:hypothetical protein